MKKRVEIVIEIYICIFFIIKVNAFLKIEGF